MKLRITIIVVVFSSTILWGMSKGTALPADEFAGRRALFLDELRDLDAIAVLHSAPEYLRNHDVHYQYRQDSDFYYLTGWIRPDAILVLTPRPAGSDDPEVTFFVAPRNKKVEVWTGPRGGVTEAAALPGVDQAFAYDEFGEHIPKLVAGYNRLVIAYGNNSEFEGEFNAQLKNMRRHPSIVQEAHSLLTKYRLIKSEREIQALETAIEITGESLKDVFPKIPELSREYELQSEIEYGFKKRGSQRLGFPSIVGSGKRATYLHYGDNQAPFRKGDLILMDVGAEWEYYTADISRTVPA